MALLLLDVTEKEQPERMSNGLVKQEDMGKCSAQIYAEAQWMIRLVEDFIKLSRLDEGVDDRKREAVDLYALTQQTVGCLLPVDQMSDVTITLEGEAAEVFGIPELLQGMVYNLCDNAIKYNRPGGTAVVSVTQEAQNVHLTVADTGIEIPAEHQERILRGSIGWTRAIPKKSGVQDWAFLSSSTQSGSMRLN